MVDVDDPVLMLAVGNSTSVGGGTELTPEADTEDGKVDVMISRSVGLLAKFGYVAHLARARHHRRDDVIYLRAREVSVTGEASSAPPTARSPAPSGSGRGGSCPRRTRWCCPRPGGELARPGSSGSRSR